MIYTRVIVDCTTGEEAVEDFTPAEVKKRDDEIAARTKAEADPKPPTTEERLALLEAEIRALKAGK